MQIIPCDTFRGESVHQPPSTHCTRLHCVGFMHIIILRCLIALISRDLQIPFPDARNSINHAHMAASIRWAVRTCYTATSSNISTTRVAQQQDTPRVLVCSRLWWIARTVKSAPAYALRAHRHIRLA